MQPILTASEMKHYEKNTIDIVGMPSLVLMERAGLFAASACLDLNPGKVLVLCGIGNNGGDALCVARLLAEQNIFVDVLLVGNREKATKENAIQLKMLGYIEDNINIITGIDEKTQYDIIIDGLFGINLNRPLADDFLENVILINRYRKEHSCVVIALDCPSGLNASSGEIYNECIFADITICFGFLKTGLYLNKGRLYSGKKLLNNVGIFDIKSTSVAYWVEKSDLNLVLKRSPIGNKSTFGKTLIIAGCAKMPGAAYMSTMATLKSGAGMVKLLTEEPNIDVLLKNIPEAMFDSYANQSSDDFNKMFEWCDNVIIGPGMSISDKSTELVLMTAKNCKKPVIFDADALNILSQNMDVLLERKENGYVSIVTPHPGEFCRLFKCDIVDKKHQNIDFIKEKSDEYGLIIVSKDASTITLYGNEVYINTSGNEGMSSAGSGDVLAGMIGSFTSKEKDVVLYTALAVYFHGLCGDYAKERYGSLNMTASNIISSIEHIKEL